jgi:fatty acid desaturase
MSLDQIQPSERVAPVEWPTLLLWAAIIAAFMMLTWWHEAIPLWLWLPLAAWTAAWWGSAQHEMLHGHPTRIRWLNTALATPPLWLWLPFESYRQSHLRHHRDDRLTDPLDDPESRYWTSTGWRELSPVGRRLVEAQSTLLGRLIIGPTWSIWSFWSTEARALADGDTGRIRIWAWHVVWVALLLGWVLGVCGVPLWQYLLGFVYLGTSLALVRSFAEHKANDAVEKRTAVVESSPILGLLFLHNNLHVVHHAWPTVPWYRIPAMYRRHREAVLAANGGLVYRGYADVFRRFFLKPHDTVTHPLERAPHRDGSVPAQVPAHAGAGYPEASASVSQASVTAKLA